MKTLKLKGVNLLGLTVLYVGWADLPMSAATAWCICHQDGQLERSSSSTSVTTDIDLSIDLRTMPAFLIELRKYWVILI